MEAASKLTCGLCGYIRPRFGATDTAWTSLCRAVYCTGPADTNPQLSGIGFHRHDDAAQLATPVPRDAGRRFNDPDLNPLSDFVHIRGIRPPPVDISEAEQAEYSWGFVFHDACWRLLEQASAGSGCGRGDDRTGEGSTAVDIRALWRILQSVPCAYDLPNWGHNYGGLYLGVAKDQARGEHFVLLSSNSNLVIPSTYSDPFRVPELQTIMARLRIDEALPDSYHREGRVSSVGGGGQAVTGDGVRNGHRDGHSEMEPPEETFLTTSSIAISPACESPPIPTETTPTTTVTVDDPFTILPLEIREMILTTLSSADVCQLRLASRSMAATPLTQYFFSSRFWPGRELEVIFDGFLLGPSRRLGLDWHALYKFMQSRLRLNQVCLGEKNRLRIWRQTVRPLARAVEAVGSNRLAEEVLGRVVFSGPGFWQTWDGGGGWGHVFGEEENNRDTGGGGPRRRGDREGWRTVTTVKQLNPESWGDMGRRVTRAEIQIPPDRMVESVVVSIVEFFDVRYITGLSFVLGQREGEAGPYSVWGTKDKTGDESLMLDGDNVVTLGYVALRSTDRTVLHVPRRRGSNTPQEAALVITSSSTRTNSGKNSTPGLLQGFHIAVDECGFRGLALIVGGAMESEYLSWAGESGSFGSYPIKVNGGGEGARFATVSAVFDGFRMQALLIPKG
ncbi:uncharacterized protein B0I36DRAFT_143622 [Microdochium trichocladiopsis]|uniref:F-box domain-containing protein n=1 Tax=Microdochium trichocladiopsis TaxID=1682393 RepID=A0A9P8Y2P3_9PEZI|nr:uncharacterized protein B0I36DRAFT_143622 [Microdochium trichocladiopsis]KAH7027798.1 hypothetical protein B0I36DRAFT_143622 [Microdochium trichocladiopsis]